MITLHKREEIASKVGISVNTGTEAREGGAGVKNESRGSSGLEGGYEIGAGNEEEKEEGHEEEEEQEREWAEEHEVGERQKKKSR